MKLPGSYQACLAVAEQRLTVLPPDEALDFGRVGFGILFIMAKWSGGSQLAFRALNKALASMPDLNGLRLHVADIDGANVENLFSTVGAVPAGTGETFWIAKGQIVHQLAGYGDAQVATIQEYTRNILACPQSE